MSYPDYIGPDAPWDEQPEPTGDLMILTCPKCECNFGATHFTDLDMITVLYFGECPICHTDVQQPREGIPDVY